MHRSRIVLGTMVVGLAIALQGCAAANPAPSPPVRSASGEDDEALDPARDDDLASEAAAPKTAPAAVHPDAGPQSGSATPPPVPVTETAAAPRRWTISGTVSVVPARSGEHAVVYLENAPVEQPVDGAMQGVAMNFSPHVLVMSVGGTLTYTNAEPFPDSAFSSSLEKWDFAMMPAKGVRTRKFSQTGVYTVLCHLHPNELAYIVVSPSSFFSKVDKAGAYTIANVPPGTYSIVAWAPKVKTAQQTVTLDSDKTVDFALHR